MNLRIYRLSPIGGLQALIAASPSTATAPLVARASFRARVDPIGGCCHCFSSLFRFPLYFMSSFTLFYLLTSFLIAMNPSLTVVLRGFSSLHCRIVADS